MREGFFEGLILFFDGTRICTDLSIWDYGLKISQY
ncbi:uncharacterized protein METZ01_LOCUS143970 [marine metagenome]|uniref:Uncharacterized protein n=1 Tax=marine metagenome TaxID=408172 RepID=A0A381ZPB0_9ZZZZ